MFKHSQILTKTLITTSLLTFSLSSHAALTFGNAEEGELKVSGTVRAKYIYDFDSDPTTSKFSLYTTNFTEPLSYQDSAFLKLPKFP